MSHMRWDKVDKIRKERGLQKQQIAATMGVDAARISDWSKGRWRSPTLDEAARLARLLGVTLDYLADDGMEEPAGAALSREEEILVENYRQARVPLGKALLAIWDASRELARGEDTAGGEGHVGLDTATGPGPLIRQPRAGRKAAGQ